jgi:hypothetical protein
MIGFPFAFDGDRRFSGPVPDEVIFWDRLFPQNFRKFFFFQIG